MSYPKKATQGNAIKKKRYQQLLESIWITRCNKLQCYSYHCNGDTCLILYAICVIVRIVFN